MPTTNVIVLLLILLFLAAMVFVRKYYSGELDLSEFMGSQTTDDMPIYKAEKPSVTVERTEYVVFGNPNYYYLDDGSGRVVARFRDIKGNEFDVYVPQCALFLLNKNGTPPDIKPMPKCTVTAYSSTENEAEAVDYLGEFYVTKRSVIDHFKYRNDGKTTDPISDTLFRQTLVGMLPDGAVIEKAVKVNSQYCNLYPISELTKIGVTPKGSPYDRYIKRGDAYELYQNTPEHT